jgi:hypothetical protein
VHDAISKVDGNNLYFLEKFEFLVINFWEIGWMSNPSLPPWARNGYDAFRGYMARYVQMTQMTRPAPAPTQAAAQ